MANDHKFTYRRGRAGCTCGWRGQLPDPREFIGHLKSLHDRLDQRRWN